MRDERENRHRLRRRISENQRRATELSIELKLESLDKDDVQLLAHAADRLESAVAELEHAHRVLVSA